MELSIKEKYWQSIFEEYESSGISQRQYCLSKGLPLSKFRYHWKKHQQQLKSKIQVQAKPSTGFAPVLCKEEPTTTAEPEIFSLRVTLPNQIRCEFNIGAGNDDSMNRILTALVSL